MARTSQPGETTVETWEITHEGTVWVWQYDRREDKYIKVRCGGRQGGSRRLHISSDDRRFNQEQVVDEMKEHDVFTNGSLRLVSKERSEDIDTTYHLSPEDLKAYFDLKDVDLFASEMADIKSELVLRRLLEIGENEATNAQLTVLRDLIDQRYRVGGTQRSVQEMIDAGEKLGGTVMS